MYTQTNGQPLLPIGTKLEMVGHEDYGTWIIKAHYDTDTYEIQGRRGGKVAYHSEIDRGFYRIVAN